MNKVKIPLQPFKAAIFDMDGTMINNMPYHKKAWQAFLERHGIPLTEEEFKRKVHGKKNDQILEMVFGQGLNQRESQKYAEEKEAMYRELYKPHITEIAGLSKIIAELHRRGLKLAIATTAPAKNREFALKALQLEGKFEVIVGDEHVAHSKPHPEIYVSAAGKLGVQPGECLVFEDSRPGVESGKNAGMTVVGILSSHSANELREADYAVNDYGQVLFS